jgi:ribosome maturation factor RimP
LISAEQISTLLQEKMDGTDMFLVSVHVQSGQQNRNTHGQRFSSFTIENCVEIHRFIESKFDREVEDYRIGSF